MALEPPSYCTSSLPAPMTTFALGPPARRCAATPPASSTSKATRFPTARSGNWQCAAQRGYVRDGWNLTGDAYIRDSDGYFHYQARTDDMIISAGYNIAAPEVEAALLTHPAVAEAGVIGEPDEARGMVVSAFVHLRQPANASEQLATELQDHVKATIAPYKYPRRLRFVDTPLPKTQTGKLQRFALHDL